jgi:hypothetical protein
MSIIAVLVGFGVLAWTDAQVGLFGAMLIACLPLVPGAYAWFRKEFLRSQVTPVNNPHDNEGRRLVPEQ